MTMLEKRPRKTVDDYMKLPDDVRAELIDGEFYYMTPAPSFRHQTVVLNLARKLADFVEARSLGCVAIAPLDVHLTPYDIVQPDAMFISKANQHIINDSVNGAPDLVVEVLSPSNTERDRIVKRDLYARNGVREYWIVEIDERSVEVLTLRGGMFEPYGFFVEPASVKSSVLSGLSLPIADFMPAT